jgi:hypothetical protein
MDEKIEIIGISNKLQSQLRVFEKAQRKDCKKIDRKFRMFTRINERKFKKLKNKFLDSEVSSIQTLKGFREFFDEVECRRGKGNDLGKGGGPISNMLTKPSDNHDPAKFCQLVNGQVMYFPTKAFDLKKSANMIGRNSGVGSENRAKNFDLE